MMNSRFPHKTLCRHLLLCMCLFPGSIFAAGKEPYVVEMVLLEEPPLRYFSAAEISRGEQSQIRLEESARSENNIVDEESWFRDNELHLESGNRVPDDVAAVIDGHKLLRAILGEEYLSLVYADEQGHGRYLFLWSLKSRRYEFGFDFGSYMLVPGETEVDTQAITQVIDWVVVKQQMLYISHSHKTHADSSRGLNAFITAIDLNTRRLSWRSDPLVSNAANFVVVGNTLVSGYGFSAEPDYLYLLNTANGKRIGKIALRTEPQYIIHKDDQVFVRTYNSDYVFRVVHAKIPQEFPREQPVESQDDPGEL